MKDSNENSINQNQLNNKKPVPLAKVITGLELQSSHNTGEFHMKSTSDNYINNTQNSPSDNIVEIRPNTDNADDSILIKEGAYEAVLISWETVIMFGKPKVEMYFKIIEFGDHLDKKFSGYYYVKRHKGKPGKKGKFIAKSSGDLLEQWYKVFPESSRLRPDRIPMQKLLNKPVKVKIKTVKLNYKGKPLPKQMYYSKVDEILPI